MQLHPYTAPEAVVVELRTDSALLQASLLEDYDENSIFGSPKMPDPIASPTDPLETIIL